jgi:hypothetical protein
MLTSVADTVVFPNSAERSSNFVALFLSIMLTSVNRIQTRESHPVIEQFFVLDLRPTPRKKLCRFLSTQPAGSKSKLMRIIQVQDADRPAPTVDPSKLLLNIIHSCFSESDAARLWLYRRFTSAHFPGHQIVRLLEFASPELRITLSSRSFAYAFEINHSAIKGAQLPGHEDPPGRG